MSTLKARFFFCKKEDAHVSFCFDIFSKVKILIFFLGISKNFGQTFWRKQQKIFFLSIADTETFFEDRNKKKAPVSVRKFSKKKEEQK